MNKPSTAVEQSADHGPAEPARLHGGVAWAIYFIAVCVGFIVIYFARSLFLPIALAIIITLTLSPIVRFGRRRGIVPGFTAVVLMAGLVIGMIVAVSGLARPITGWIDDAPSISWQVEQKLRSLRAPVDAVNDAEKEVDKLTGSSDPDVREVVVKRPGLLTRVADDFFAIIATIIVTIGLATFLLAYSDTFYEKLMRIIPKLSDKKRALRMVYEIEQVVSNYLLTITVINIALGIAIGLAMWAIGMPTPYLWGVAAAVLNFLPYIGALIGLVLVSVVSLVTFDTIFAASLVPICYTALTVLEGHFITPMVLGRRLEINPVIILLSVALWGFVWGIIGVLLAVPIAIIVKVSCDHIEQASSFAEFLSAGRAQPEPSDAETAPAE
ncbi:MAG TPA: AI-2E family transporter [Afifellaceae bacterium]|nr:AI-2E family transporter [Afifellaceae bacterium]